MPALVIRPNHQPRSRYQEREFRNHLLLQPYLRRHLRWSRKRGNPGHARAAEHAGLMPATKSATEPGGCLAWYVDRILRGGKPADLRQADESAISERPRA